MARKKIVFVIVEGPSDDEALGVMLDRIFDRCTVYVEIMHCDITTESRGPEGRVATKVAGFVRRYAQRNHYTMKDFREIIHIIDTDGAFVPDDVVFEDANLKKVRYTTTDITAKYRDAIIARNRQKSENLCDLCRRDTILGSIPYRIYYMSSNLDHVLYNKLNCTNDEKGINSFRFAMRYKDDLGSFMRFISESDFSYRGDYTESWEYIKEGLHSLERHTNIGLCFAKEIAETGNV